MPSPAEKWIIAHRTTTSGAPGEWTVTPTSESPFLTFVQGHATGTTQALTKIIGNPFEEEDVD